MPIPPDTHSEIDALVRGGFENRERIIEIFCEEMYAPGELDPAQVEAAVDSAIAAHKVEQATWPGVTDCERLDSAFDALNWRGILALQNAGYTQSDGYGDFREAYHGSPDAERFIGYCFYHGQDLERAVAGGGLYIAFGPVDPRDEETKGPHIGNIVVEELQRAGFQVRWDGTFNQRIGIPQFDWKRR